jgi:putative aldouronate transport system permease protein
MDVWIYNKVMKEKRLGKVGRFRDYAKGNWGLYLMCIPGLVFLCVYKFAPLYGLTLAFKEYDMFAGTSLLDSLNKSPWVGLAYVKKVFESSNFLQLLANTLIISLYKIIFLFPVPIIVALLLNEVKGHFFKSSVQTMMYLPHFLSWVIIYGIFFSLLSSDGIVNSFLIKLHFQPVNFLSDPKTFRSLLVFTEGWKETGWSCIIYLSALTGIDPALYEAATVDGAGRFGKMWHVTLPGLTPVIVMMLMLKVGNILQAGYEQILVMYNPAVYKVGDVIQTWVYRVGLGQMDFSTGTVVGLFESVVGFILIIVFNSLCKKTVGRSLW